MTQKTLALAGLVGTLSVISIVTATSNQFVGLLFALAAMVTGIGIGSVFKANSDFDRKLGAGSLTEAQEMEAVKWAVFALGGFTLLILDQLFFFAGVAMILYGLVGYFTSETVQSRKIEIMLQRFGVALLFFLAWNFSGLLILPIAALMARFTWVFVPDQKKQNMPSIGDIT